uniref:SJCHGC08010 protein n=2 Tax=Schistosoma japonicum TaxID=6182 RepID=Q5DEC4_SCHJA|nr:SJCHGC08010 protein [Schistosoma japonicum]
MFKAENLMPNNNEDTTTTEDVFHEMHSKQITFTYAHNYTVHTSINLLESSENVKLNETNYDIIDDYLGKAVILCNLVILVSYQLNFAIYYIMSTQFKETFNSLCCNKRFTLNRN